MAHPSLPVADCHNDLLLGVLHQRERGLSDPFGDFWLPELRAGGVVLQVLPVFTEEQHVGEGALRRSLQLLEEARRLADVHAADVVICERGDQLRPAIESGRIALVLALEGCEPIGHSLELLDTFHRLGVRIASMTWNRRTMLADGVGEEDAGGRLTSLGLEAVREMERLGLLVDVSHLSEVGFWHLASVATRPFVASHSSCQALRGHPRNLSDEQLRAVAGSGGFVALNGFGPFLSEDTATVDSFLRHVLHAVSLVGSEHVALGLDFMRDLVDAVDPVLQGALVDPGSSPWVVGLERPSDLAGLAGRIEDVLGPDSASRVCAGTVIDTLAQHMDGPRPR
jgi:membrane dipeptidase